MRTDPGIDGNGAGRLPFGVELVFLNLVVDVRAAAPDVVVGGQALGIGRGVGVVGAAEAVVIDRAAGAPVEPQVDVLAADSREVVVFLAATLGGRTGGVEG
ncbi:hypothetical protein D3C85_1608860 [compost metagenome]